jgi:cellulose synthase/poly-beta-1,6-N-acetylglucosamine synthase-like glycosyltransferase
MGRLGKLGVIRRRVKELLAAPEAAQGAIAAAAARNATIDARLEQVSAQLGFLIEAEQQRRETEGAFQADVIAGMRRIHANEAWHRRRLREMRRTLEYESAYVEPNPLISVLIPTYERLELLRSRAIPSILAQQYPNLEIVIVGDCAPYEAAEVTAGFADAPIRYVNLTLRGPYPEVERKRWLVSGSSPLNEAMAIARGVWLAPFADDDEMRPNHLTTLLAAARERRLEFVYGRLSQHLDGGVDAVLGSFPPRLYDIGLQAGLLHGHLRVFEFELADAEFGVPNDWGLIERMARAGVRMGMVDDIVADYYPSLRAMRTDQ